MGALISVVSEYDPAVVAGAIFNGPGVTVQAASWIAIAEAAFSPAGTFTNGPYGIGSGGILTNGFAIRAGETESSAQPDTNNQFPGSEQYCGSQTFDATILEVRIEIDNAYEGVEVEFILSSVEYSEGRPDPIGIYLDGTLWSIDDSNHRITATSEYLNEEIGINELDKYDFPFGGEMERATRYDGSSPPLLIGIPAVPGEHTMIFAICDSVDRRFDSALMVKAKGCKDCDPQVRINYVSTTTTTGSTSFTSTTKAIGTESGTVLFGVPAEETTTTTEDVTTTTADFTTTQEPTTTATDISTEEPTTTATDTSTEEPTTTVRDASTTNESSATADTTTTTESQESSTATSDIVFTDSTTQTLDQSSTAISTFGTTTEESTQMSTVTDLEDTTTLSQITTIASSSTESLVETGSTSLQVSTTLPEPSTMTDQRTVSSSTTGEEPIPASETISTTNEVSTTVLPITTSTEGIDTQTLSVETTQPSLPDTTSVEDVQSTRSIEQSNSLTPIVPDSTSLASSPTETAIPTNLEVIGDFTFIGCLGSPEGYPSFDLVATSDDMTPSKCVSLAMDRLYVGIYDRSCYASDSLESTGLVGEGQCNTPCRGAPLLFCGGLVGTNDALQRRSRFRRDAPSDVLLTLYGVSGVGDSSSSALVTGPAAATSVSEIIGGTSVIPGDESATTIEPVTSDSIPDVITRPTASSLELDITSGQAVPFPPNRPVPTSGWLGKNNMTQAANSVITVSTITYTIIDPQNPSTFKVEEYCSTIEYYPCHRCEHQDIPAVHMTTIQRQCNACGVNGENSVYLTLPAAVAAPSATDRFTHVGNSPQHGSEPFVASPVETGFHHPKPIIQAKPTKAQHYNPLPPVSEEEDVPVRLNENQPQVHPEDDFPKEPQVEAPKAPINEPKPVDKAHPTSKFVGGYEIKTTTLPTWNVPSEVPVIVSTATMSFPIFGTVFLVFAFASLLNSM